MSEWIGAAPEAAVRDLLEDAKSTAGSRFNASKRLAAKDRALTRLTAFTSAYIIIFTALPYIAWLNARATDHLNILNISLAIIVLVSSLLQYSSNDVVNAEQHHRCSLEINELRRKLKARKEMLSAEELRGAIQAYNEILQKYSVNHDNVDYLRHKLTHPKDYPGLTATQKSFGDLRLIINEHLITAILLLGTIACAAVTSYYVIPFDRIPTAVRRHQPEVVDGGAGGGAANTLSDPPISGAPSA